MNAAGCSILLLEDEPLILMDLEFAVEDVGAEPLCATNVAQALKLLDSNKAIKVAVLDVSLRDGETCAPVAKHLKQSGIPFLLHSGDLDRRNELVRSLGAQLVAKPSSADAVVHKALEAAGLGDASGTQGDAVSRDDIAA
ncbi:response regulator [Altericroceibacterium indicum]|uniref:response regulator n=1 Tax=Altericroceibacterium indicum TaxID=374177 RepID=UPI001B85BE4C|nr:response regulator [Altericroceibacterium indicum]